MHGMLWGIWGGGSGPGMETGASTSGAGGAERTEMLTALGGAWAVRGVGSSLHLLGPVSSAHSLHRL